MTITIHKLYINHCICFQKDGNLNILFYDFIFVNCLKLKSCKNSERAHNLFKKNDALHINE